MAAATRPTRAAAHSIMNKERDPQVKPIVDEVDTVHRNILYFIHLIRKSGIPISTAEIIDALTGLQHINLLAKEQVKVVLRSTLIKDADGLPVFGKAFDFFFAPTALHGQIIEQKMQSRRQLQEKVEEAIKDLAFQGEPLELTREQNITYAHLAEESKQNIRDYLEKASGGSNVRDSFRGIIQNAIAGKLNRQKDLLESGGIDLKDPYSPENAATQAALDAINDALAEDKNPIYSTDMSAISDADLQEAIILIKRFARKMAVLLNRKYRRTSQLSKLDFKNTIHASVRYGGTPLRLQYKKRSVEKPQMLFICDVSGSMHQYSKFLMLLMYGLNHALRGLQGFVCADTLEKISHLLRQAQDTTPEQVLEMLTLSPCWGRGTNLNSAFSTLLEQYKHDLQRQTVVLIYSDGKSEHYQKAARQVEAIRHLVKKVIWLSPTPEKDWAKIPLIKIIQPSCPVLHCSTLASLQGIIKAQFEQ